MAQHLYQAAGAKGAGPSPDGGTSDKGKGKDDVIDAEFEVKN